MDIDHLKRFNGHNGHSVGDKLLGAFSTALKANLRTDQPVARMGGDKFAILLPGATELEAIECANRIRESARQALAWPQPQHCGDEHCLGPTQLSVCVGVGFLGPAMTWLDLVNAAENKVDLAKTAGRDRVWR